MILPCVEREKEREREREREREEDGAIAIHWSEIRSATAINGRFSCRHHDNRLSFFRDPVT